MSRRTLTLQREKGDKMSVQWGREREAAARGTGALLGPTKAPDESTSRARTAQGKAKAGSGYHKMFHRLAGWGRAPERGSRAEVGEPNRSSVSRSLCEKVADMSDCS